MPDPVLEMNPSQFPSLEEISDEAVIWVILNNQDYSVTAAQFKQLLLADLPPAELPDGVVYQSDLQAGLNTKADLTALAGYVTSQQLADAIEGIQPVDIGAAVAAYLADNPPALPEGTVTEDNLAAQTVITTIQASLAAAVTQTSFNTYQQTVTDELALKADQTAVDAALADKADVVSVNAALANKADVAALVDRVELTEYNNYKNIIQGALDEKANQAQMFEYLNEKLNTSAFNTFYDENLAALALKADATALADLVTSAELQAAIDGVEAGGDVGPAVEAYLTNNPPALPGNVLLTDSPQFLAVEQGLADRLTIDTFNNFTTVNSGLLGDKVDVTAFTTYQQSISDTLGTLATSEFVNQTFETLETQTNDALALKADVTALTALQDVVNEKIDATALTPYVTSEVLTTALANKADVAALADLVTSAELQTAIEGVNVDQAVETYLTNNPPALPGNVITTDNLAAQQLLIDLDTAVDSKADTSALTALQDVVNEKIDATALTPYVTSEVLTTLLTAKADVDALSDFINQADLNAALLNRDPESPLSDLVTTTAFSALEDLVNEKIDISALTPYVTSEVLTTVLASKADVSALADLVSQNDLTAALSDRTLESPLSDLVTTIALSTALNDYATSTDLTDGLALKANVADLANYATTAALALKADATALDDLVTSQELTDGLALKLNITDFSTFQSTVASDLADRVTEQELTDAIATVNASTGLLPITTVAVNTVLDNTLIGKQLDVFSDTGSLTVTVPGDSEDNLPIGYIVPVCRTGDNGVTFVPGASVVFQLPDSKNPEISGKYQSATLHKVAANTWRVTGSLADAA